MKAYVLDLRERIVQFIQDGGSTAAAARRFRLARSSVHRYVGPGQHEGPTWQPDHPFVRTAVGVRRQMPEGLGGEIPPDDGKVAGFEFKEGRASAKPGGLDDPANVRRRARSAFDHGLNRTIVR